MKKIILITSSFLLMISAKSQTINDTNIANLGDIIYGATDVSPLINLGTNSSGNTWNFSSLLINGRDTTTMEHPWNVFGTSSMMSHYPTATHGIADDTNYIFLRRSATALELIGLSNGTAHVKSQDSETIITFPSVFGTTFKDTSKTIGVVSGASVGQPLADSIKVISETYIESDFSASGTLTTPFGIFSSIRQYLIRDTYTETWAKGVATGGVYTRIQTERDTAYSHQYWSDAINAKFPLVSYDIDASGNLTGSVEWMTGFTVNPTASISEFTQKAITVFPNPTSNQITIEESTKINEVVIMDVSGKKVMSLSNLSNNTIDVENLPKGVYVIQISTNNYVGTTKFVKQ